MASLGKHQWYVGEDGCIPIGEPAKNVTYHSALNSIIVTTEEPAVKIYDVTSGAVLQKSDLCAKKGEVVQSMYLPEKNCMVFRNGTAIGVRKDLQGVLLMDTALQTPLSSQDEKVRLELPLAEASQFLKSMTSAELQCTEAVDTVVKELQQKITAAQEATKGNHKTAKWATVCLEVPFSSLKSASSSLVAEMQRLNIHRPGLSIASAVNDRLGYLLPGSREEVNPGGPIDRSQMYSEAARRDTFVKWPHMNYKWALPDPMAQAGFYHQPNIAGDDRALCFTCNVCLVCWEPTDEPWSEHERHSPSCPFVRGEHTQNVPLSVTYATQPALLHSVTGERIQCVSTTASEDYIATSTKHGHVVVWNLKHKMKKHSQFVIDTTETLIALKTGLQVDRRESKTGCTDTLTNKMEDSLEMTTTTASKGAEGSTEDDVDAKQAMPPPDNPKFCLDDGEELMEIPLHETTLTDDGKCFIRPNEDIVVTSLCLVEKPDMETAESQGTKSASKKDRASKVKKRPIQPSLICGVSLRRPKTLSNCDDNAIGSDIQTDVQLMNQVNQSVSEDTSPQIITDSNCDTVSQTNDDLLNSTTNFVPYLLVLSVKEDIKRISKHPSSDSLKPSPSTSNMVPSLGSMSINQPDWSLIDMYDSDPEVQIVKVTHGPTTLSTSSPTETSKLEEKSESLNESRVSLPESAIKRLSNQRSGDVLQCVEFPSDLQSEHLEVKSIHPTLDKQHLIVVLSPKLQCSSASVLTRSSDLSSCPESCSNSGPSVEVITSNSDSQTDSKKSSGFSEMSDTGSDVNTNTNETSAEKSPLKSSNCGCILIYRFNYDCDYMYASIEETPVVVRYIDEDEGGVEKMYVLPGEVCEHVEEEEILHCDDDICVPAQSAESVVQAGKQSGLYGQLAVILTSGKLSILNTCDLTHLATIQPTRGDKFTDVAFCSGIDRLCLCSSQGKLYFYQLSEEVPDQSDSVIEGELTPTAERDSVFTGEATQYEDGVDQSPKSPSVELLAKQSLTFESLSQIHSLIQFENLMPRFTATVPPCWTEMQQEQQQRRHPQHLQHQGEATQHTRTWKLQPDGNTWDEHLFEIVLPKVCCVGHVDVKFTLSQHCQMTPNIQMTLLKQNVNAIGRLPKPSRSATSTPVDKKINFNIKQPNNLEESESSSSSASATVINNVLDPQYLQSHNAEVLCGPVNISECMDLSGNGGIVSLTSPQLLLSKPRSFLLHIKGFPSKQSDPQSDRAKEIKKKRTAAQALDKNKKTIKALFENYNAIASGKTKVENFKGCDWLTEVSVTIRKTKKTNIPRERIQRNAVIDVTSFHEKLVSTVAFEDGYLLTGISADYIQNICLDILSWITSIQMKDPDTRSSSRCILSTIQPKLKEIIQACYIQGTRTTAHKCSRLLSQCMQYSKHLPDPDYAPVFSLCLLEALLDCLPLLPCMVSAGSIKWFFTLLNRVKLMDVTSTSAKCCQLLGAVSKHFHERGSTMHAILKARYGLNGHPFEPDLFDMEIPQAIKQIIPGSQPISSFTSTVTGTSSTGSSGTTATGTQIQDDLDFYELFNGSSEKSTKSLMEHARNHILGMLEVEPLHFTCHSTSDGTKMERLDSVSTSSSASVIHTGIGTTSIGGNIGGSINFGEPVPTSFNPTQISAPLPYSLPQTMAAAKHLHDQTSKNYQSVKHKIMHIKQMLHEVNKNIPTVIKVPVGSSELMPSTPKTTPQVMTPPLTPPNEAFQQIFLQGDKSDSPKNLGQQPRPSLSVPPTHGLLQPPPPQVLVIERIYSGARRFVILDLGKPVLLTDVIIPLCSDLASLSIDVWIQGEETDGQRLIVASDIGSRSLVMNNIMPPPVCRYLKITTIGRYGSGTTRSKIPIGAFYGHSYILPWEWSPRSEHWAGGPFPCKMDIQAQSQLLTQLGSFMSLLEDIQCRYSLARARLSAMLQQVEALQYANFHTQYYLKKSKNNDEDNNIIQAYNECLQLQLQQNLAMRAIYRLQSAIGLRVPTTQYPTNQASILNQASTDKLRCILENLLETLISITNTSPSPASLYTSLDHQMCQDVFKHLCFHGMPRLQILTSMVLVRVCGSQAWFGEFLGNMLREYFHSETMQVFSQDRVFILLTAMGQRALQGPSAVSIMESLLSMLAGVLSPIHRNVTGVMSPTGQLDLTLIGWILLFMCRNLDNTIATNGNGEDEGASAKKGNGFNLFSRWNFIGANGNVKSQINKTQSVRMYRRSLHKRLLHHKQKLLDIDHMKKNFMAQDQSISVMKHQGKQFWKELTQYASKIRKTDAEVLRKLPRDERLSEEKEPLEAEQDTVLILPKEKCLPVVHGLMALLLGMDFTCNVDLFLITCKVMARICISTRPAIMLTEAMNQEQLERLIMLAASLEFNNGNISWGGPWAGHALTCLLQDILEGERVFPCNQYEGITDDEISTQVTDDSLQSSVINTLDLTSDTQDSSGNDSLSVSTIEAGSNADLQDTSLIDQETSLSQSKDESSMFDKESAMMVDMLVEDWDDYDDTPEKLHSYLTGENIQPPSTSVSNSMVGSVLGMDKYKPGKENLAVKAIKAVFGSTGYPKPPLVDTKPPQNNANNTTVNATPSQGLSTALDARLELGLETQCELRLRTMLSLQSDMLHYAFTSSLPLPPSETRSGTQSRSSPSEGDMIDTSSGMPQMTSFEMLSRAFDDLFGQLLMQRVNLDALLQLWLTLNEESPYDAADSGQTQFDASRCPTIPLSVTSVTNLLACVAMQPSLPVRTWVLVFQSLTLLANLRISTEEQRSMVVAMMGDNNLVAIITKFLSGTSVSAPVSSYDSNTQVGPSAVKAFHLFLQRLRVCICGEDDIHNLKEIMLKLVYTLTAERGAFHSSLGPLDAQCKFLEFILELTYEQVDINNAISVIESVSGLVHRHILCQEKVHCKSTSDNGVDARSCFGGMFASLLRGGDSSSRNGDYSRDSLMCSLLKLVIKLLQVHFPSRHARRVSLNNDGDIHSMASMGLSEPVTDSTKLSQALASLVPVPHGASLVSQSDEEKVGQASEHRRTNPGSEQRQSAQTDEQKTENAQHERTYVESQGINLSDIILDRRTIMCNFIQALSYCNSSTMAMLLGSSGLPSNMQDSFTGGDPLSVGDGIYQILVTLSRQCSDSRHLMEAMFLYLSGGFLSHGSPSLCRLSEPLLWFMLKVLDSPKMMKHFLDKGGVEVICRNFVNCNSRIISTNPSLISTIMQNMNGQTNIDKRKKWELESNEGLQNFAPLGTIVSCSPTASPAEVLIVSTPQHRRARSAPWSYHFYPDEAWVDLKITLPFAILLREVQIQPHSPALSTCPAYVSLEASQDGITTFPLCAPMNTSSLVFIKLQLQRSEVITSVTIRLHRARDSMTIGLSQILLMGYSAFGDVGYKPNNLFLPTEDFVSRSSVGWIRLLHHCLVSQSELESAVAEAAAPTRGLLDTCTALLVSPISSVYSPTIEAVLLRLGLHSSTLGLSLIDNLLRSHSHVTGSHPSSQYLGKMGGIANESTVEILYQMGTVQDRWTADRLKAMLKWLEDSAQAALQRKAMLADLDRFSHLSYEMNHLTMPGPAPSHVHCIAAILWHSNETRVEYNLSQLVTRDLVSSLYQWSSMLNVESHLKKSVDFVLCAICHICPDAFTRIMEWMGIVITPEYGLTASIPDDRKGSSRYHDLMTDDSKEANSALGQSEETSELVANNGRQGFKNLHLDNSHLSTLALACQSTLATKQLLESGFPAVLAQGLFEICNRVISNFSDSWSQPEGISDSCKSMSGTTAGQSSSTTNNHTGLTITAGMVSSVLNLFSDISSLPAMKDWLGGADGNIFWPVLLTMLCNTPLNSPISLSAFPQKVEMISTEERASIETASVKFFRSVISCHVPNQMLFAKVLYDVIKEQGSTNKAAGLGVCPLSGFTRRLFLQVLLEDESILVAFRTAPKQNHMHVPATQGVLQHPQFGAGRRFRTITVNMHTTIGELINKVSDTPSLHAQLLDVKNGKKSDESKESTCQIGLELVDVIENMSTGKSDSPSANKPAVTLPGTTSTGTVTKTTLPQRPPSRRGRNDPTGKHLSIPVLSLYHKLITNKSLPSDMTLSQLMQVLQGHGMTPGQDVLDFMLKLQNGPLDKRHDLSDDVDDIPVEVMLASTPFPTPLQVFASVNGLALLAEHLPLLYPEISRQMSSPDSVEAAPSVSAGNDPSQDWVTLDSYPEDFYMLYEPMSPVPPSSQAHHMGHPTIPPHSLVAFGLFLRLPGYAEVLLKERKKAQCLLRLMLGVTDDGGGGQILTSPLANSLPTLPFIVLKSLFDSTPLTTDDGVLLRRMCLENGALHLILACLSVLSHHSPRVSTSGFQQEAYTILSAMQTPTATPTQVAGPSEEKSQQYWAKGTGFGTGSTTSNWDAEQALIRQRSEEEHVTCLLQVLASYINPGGNVPENFDLEDYEPATEWTLLPDVVPDMLTQSCLVPALSSYLRNDSVLDMARHVPLYRALLQLLRGISVCPSLVILLLPLEKENGSEAATAVGELLEKMRACVDTYASRLKSNKGKIIGTKEEEEENEGLAMLIPDIQLTATIVHVATDRLKLHQGCDDEDMEKDEESPDSSSQEGIDQIYLNEMQKLQFDQYEMVTEEGSTIKFAVRHHYENSVKAAGDIKNPTRIRRLAQEAVTLSTSLPLSVSSSVFVRCDEERLDIMKVLITGPEDTPYANGCFEFDVYFPPDYPNAPPYINLETTGNHTVRFNPNLYNDGKVCLSVLNTWHGRPEEKWNSQTSSFLQVLVSIQSLILVSEPYFNEPGYERSRGTVSGNASSREYDANIRQATVKWAILEQLKSPPPCFKEVVLKHFWLKRHKILKQCEEWITEMETYSNDKRTGRTISHNTMALKKHYNQLREEFSKMKAPEGLEEVEKGDIDPNIKHYSTDQNGTSAGASGSKDTTHIVPADNNANSLLADNIAFLFEEGDMNSVPS